VRLRLTTRVVARSADEANRAGVGLWGTGRYERALAVFEALALRHPSSSTVQGNLAANYRALGRDRDADAAFRKALELDPMDTVVEKAFAEFQASKKAPRPDGKASEAAKPQ